jgi:tight adherence protein C
MGLALLAIVLFLTIAAVVFTFGAAVYAPSSVIGSRLRTLGFQKAQKPVKPAFKERLEQALDPLSKALPLSPSDVSRTRAWLIQAGYRENRHLTIYVGSRVLLAIVGMAAVVAISGVKSLPLIIGVGGLGFFLPRFVLKRMIRERQRRIKIALPDALDLTVICVEAGLALDQALQRVGEDLRHAHPELSTEFNFVNLEIRAGKPRVEALRNLAARTGVDDMRSLVATLVQTDRFGTSVAQALRVHSDSLRTERRQRAEEQAAKTTIKMVIPLVLFILPSILIVTLGPAMIELYRTLTQR